MQLPVEKYKKEIESTIAKNPVTVLTAETGAGKSTQVPMWLWKQGKIVHVTQPRRIAARSISHYLAQLSNTELGKEVGFQTGFESKHSRQTRLLYVTDGVQMVREIKGRRPYDVLVLDEVHEWNLNQEILVGLLKKYLHQGFFQKSGKRVVIMSATLQANRLSRFLGDAPVISVPGRGYPVTMHHNDPRFLLPDTAQMVELERNVLVFQPGKKEITTFIDDLQRMLEAEKIKAKILPLHSELALKEQEKVFRHYGLPKVVVATDIAQTSLTIDDIDAVVDCGLKKEVRLVRGIEGLYPVDISAAECRQRAGRAGRVRSGRYFLCADAAIEDRMPFPEPEIQRLNLESVVLRLTRVGISPLDFPFFHAPSKALVHKALKQLKMLGALTDEGTVTKDGEKMAELPVSLRSSRLLLEAQKGPPRVVDSALKCVAILESKGITGKEFSGEKFGNIAYDSDLLNQLALWDAARLNRRTISGKKFALANEVYRELKKRIQLPPIKHRPSLKDMDLLFRAILSSFADEVLVKSGQEYQRENDIRQLDRTSVLFKTRPDMLVGLPFDLVVNRENRDTGQNEQWLIPLITFASEINLDLLDTLKPFSYSKNENTYVENNQLRVFRRLHFGGRLLKEFTSPPIWDRKDEKDAAADVAIKWFEENRKQLPLATQLDALETHFNTIRPQLKDKPKPFNHYYTDFLRQELRQHLNMEDLPLFFNLHRGFKRVTLKELLPQRFVKEIKKTGWPTQSEIGGKVRPLRYVDGRPFLKIDHEDFEKVKEEELLLPTGDQVWLVLDGTTYRDWTEAVDAFNQWKKNTFFEKKLKDIPKPVHMDDLIDMPFPQPFESGGGKDNVPFQYYMVPKPEGNGAVMVHFMEKDEAEAFFAPQRTHWEAHVARYKKSKLENIFKQKGWKVR